MLEEVVIGNPEEIEKIKAVIRKQGKSKLHVVSDFDRTLTYSSFEGIRTPSLISHLRNGKYLTADYALKAHVLYDKYRPIEIDESLSMVERNAEMNEWWKAHFELLVKSGLDMKTIEQAVDDMVKEGRLRLRKGVKEFLDFLHMRKIPLVIMSASIGDMIVEFLRKQNVFYNNIHIVANLLEFDERGKFKGVKNNKVIHSLNKHETELKDTPFYKEIEKRRNVLLLGDSLDDLGMVEGFNYENLLSVGFLNEEAEANLSLFKKNYDVVLLGDPEFEYVNKLVRELVK